MQILYIQVKNKAGKKVMRAMYIVRAWTESDGRQLFLHRSGMYGYKDGSPIKKASELDIISSKIQHKLALRWWNTVGLKLSAQFYAQEAKRIEELQMSGIPAMAALGDVSDLDAVTYMRRPAAEQGVSAYSDPCTWYEWFPSRPEWWGQATIIEIAGYHYSMAVDVEEEEERTERETETEDEETETEDEGPITEPKEQEEFTTSDATTDEYETTHKAMVAELEQAHANAALDKLAQLTDALGVKFVVDNIKQVDNEKFSTLSRKINKLATDLL